MKIRKLEQGSPQWLAHRRTTRNASDAPVMMGISPNISRRELVKLRATGLDREHSDYVQKNVLDRGHQVEPKLRALAEHMLGEDLYPVTGVTDDGYLGASFDGVTLDESAIFEAKQYSAEKIALVEQNQLPPQDYWQVVQQFAVCESAKVCVYVVGDGTEERTRYMRVAREQIEADIPKLLAGWEQFDKDVAAYVPEAAAAPAPVGRAPDRLPALHIEVTGMVTASNLREWKDSAIAVFKGISTDLQTDQDFADAEQTVKFCADVESQLKAAKQHALSQTASIDELFRVIDSISAEARAKRLELEKLVTREKEARRLDIVTRGRDAYVAHLDELKAETNGVWLPLPPPDFAGAIKGKRTLSSMQDAVDTVLAHAKIAANESAKHIRAALACLTEETAEHKHLFPDYLTFIAKPVEDIRALVRGRIAEHQQREQERLDRERERIRQEEQDKLAAEQRQRDEDARRAAEPAPAPAPVAAPPVAAPAAALSLAAVSTPAAVPAARIKLGDLNAAIAPLSITADGLAALGFRPVGTERAAKLYAGEDFPRICAALVQVIQQAPARAAQKAAA